MSGAAARVADCDRQLGRHPRAALVAALSAALPSRPADRIVAAADAVLVVGGAGRRHRGMIFGHCRSMLVLFLIGAFAMRGAGCTWNDITDRDLDAQVERTRSRPIPAGQVSVPQAAAFLVAAGADRACRAAAVQPLRGRDRHRLAGHRRGLSVHEAHHLVAADRARPRLLVGRADGICGDRSAGSMRRRLCCMPARSPG